MTSDVVKKKSDGKLIKSIVITIMVIVIVTGCLVFTGVYANKRHEKLLEKEKNEAILKLADRITGAVNDVEANYKTYSVDSDGIIIDFTEYSSLLSQYGDLEGEFYNDGYDYVYVTGGKIFKDIDGKIIVLSNLKIDDIYCIYENDKFECDESYKEDTGITEFNAQKVYYIGDVVTLSDGSTWRVVRDSSKYSEYVSLLSDTILFNPVNGNNLWSFSPSGNKKYDVEDERSIAYYLDPKYKRLLSYDGIYDARLLSYHEHNKIDDEDWLENANLGQWLYYNYQTDYAWYKYPYLSYYGSQRYSTYSLLDGEYADVEYTLRPVITIRKDKIDTSNVNTPLVENEVVE